MNKHTPIYVCIDTFDAKEPFVVIKRYLPGMLILMITEDIIHKEHTKKFNDISDAEQYAAELETLILIGAIK